MAFHDLLYNISEELDSNEIHALKFLCLDIISSKKQEGIRDAKDLFLKLQEKGLLEDGDRSFIKELLFRINRNDLLIRKLNTSKEEMNRELQVPGKAKITSYRHLLFQLSENISEEEMRSFMFFLDKKLPRSKLQNEDTTMLEIFIEMEKRAILGEHNFDTLKDLCGKINKELLRTIEDYQLNRSGSYPVSLESSTQFSIPDAYSRCEEGSLLSETVSPVLCDFPTNQEEYFQTDSVYKMDSRPRGKCLIINNYNFEKTTIPRQSHLKNRNGTDKDAEALCRVFTMLHFKTEVHKDLTGEEILKTIHKYSTENHQASDCFVCCILTHGDKGIIFGTDGQEVPIQRLTTFFNGRNCPSLAGKPKVFIMQACQGMSFHKAVNVETDGQSSSSPCEVDSNICNECIPEEADFLLGMATMTDYVSYRSPDHGTWYIQSLCKHLKECCPRGHDLLTILTNVNHEVSKKFDRKNQGKQMPQPSFTLRKKLVFPVD
ncbi:caspase-8 [Microcaecilia unicolor]|uniref:Caspase-8 n=1 Tax=Microcaecilia unicolor TaxID=1415580 RepID=A0A6P7YSW9_9AMPH|nr:caspase-8-like [Microcaecilia unicolor]XP_030066355.1 caspase-8-like [Microcaecilia unicolor]